jgi:hypothetical protein
LGQALDAPSQLHRDAIATVARKNPRGSPAGTIFRKTAARRGARNDHSGARIGRLVAHGWRVDCKVGRLIDVGARATLLWFVAFAAIVQVALQPAEKTWLTYAWVGACSIVAIVATVTFRIQRTRRRRWNAGDYD